VWHVARGMLEVGLENGICGWVECVRGTVDGAALQPRPDENQNIGQGHALKDGEWIACALQVVFRV
jgi:hypothetical protein